MFSWSIWKRDHGSVYFGHECILLCRRLFISTYFGHFIPWSNITRPKWLQFYYTLCSVYHTVKIPIYSFQNIFFPMFLILLSSPLHITLFFIVKLCLISFIIYLPFRTITSHVSFILPAILLNIGSCQSGSR